MRASPASGHFLSHCGTRHCKPQLLFRRVSHARRLRRPIHTSRRLSLCAQGARGLPSARALLLAREASFHDELPDKVSGIYRRPYQASRNHHLCAVAPLPQCRLWSDGIHRLDCRRSQQAWVSTFDALVARRRSQPIQPGQGGGDKFAAAGLSLCRTARAGKECRGLSGAGLAGLKTGRRRWPLAPHVGQVRTSLPSPGRKRAPVSRQYFAREILRAVPLKNVKS
jgi:hypothetical protein